MHDRRSTPHPHRRVVALLLCALAVAGACSRAPAPTDLAAGEGPTTTVPAFEVAPAPTDSVGGQAPAPVDGATPTVPGGEAPAPVDGAAPTVPAPGSPAAPNGQPAPTTPAGEPASTTASETPASPTGPQLWGPEDDRRGISDDAIVFCAHAALTYGAAFNTSAEDLNVYWTAVNDAGGVYGRKVEVYYENDNYQPDTAIQAAEACVEKYDPFLIFGGIGFDQIPAVREWAENNRMLYIHHTATENGAAGKRYSFAPLASTEKMGELFAELAHLKFPGQKVGIIKRESVNWEPGIDGFKRVAQDLGVSISLDRAVAQNKGSYLQDIVDLRNADTDVVFVWLNALETTEFVQQVWAQNWRPQFMVFPFNFTSQTLGDGVMDPPMVGVNMHNAYSPGDYAGPFAPYADDIKQFEAQYDKYRPNADYRGVGSDLMFLNWASQKNTHYFLLECGPDCTRNEFAEILMRTKGTTAPSVCPVDFTRPESNNGRKGGFRASVLEPYQGPDGNFNWRNTQTCVEHVG